MVEQAGVPAQRRLWTRTAGVLVLGAAVVLWGPALVRLDVTGDVIARFLLATALIVAACNGLAALVGKVGQPPVVGEMLGGLLLGPSVFGALAPSVRDWFFPAGVLASVQTAAQLGLVTFMFLLGTELRFDHVRAERRVIGTVVVGSAALPFAAGLAVAHFSSNLMAPAGADTGKYQAFFGLAISITALPVLARILLDLGLGSTRLGSIALCAAAIGDGGAWLVLTIILATGGPGGAVGMLVILALITILFIRPALAAFVRRQVDERRLMPILLSGAIVYAALTQFAGLHAVIGAFLFGIAVPRKSVLVERVTRQVRGFATTVLLPLFFAGIGISVSIGSLGGTPSAWFLLAAVLVVAIVSKFTGVTGSALLAGLPGRDAVHLGTLMNCRGVTELVVATVGLQHNLINSLGFTVLVLVAVVTTVITSPLSRLVAT